MTDQKIKEEFDKWLESNYDQNEYAFACQYKVGLQEQSLSFYGGFKTSERLAKIEVLEELNKIIVRGFPDYDRFLCGRDHENTIICSEIKKLISELKDVVK
jgi:hypothetical protein